MRRRATVHGRRRDQNEQMVVLTRSGGAWSPIRVAEKPLVVVGGELLGKGLELHHPVLLVRLRSEAAALESVNER